MKDITLENYLKSIQPTDIVQPKKLEKPGVTTEGKTFSETLKESISEVNQLQKEAETAIQDLATGKTNDIHNTMIAIEKADISFKMMMKVRNKILDAYQEIMRMQV